MGNERTPNKLVRTCRAINCHDSGLQDSTAFFRFPLNPVLKQKWLENLGLAHLRHLPLRTVICRRHFTADCLGKRKVYNWAVPTLHLGTGVTEGIHQPVKTIKYKSKCCVRNCTTKSPEILHSFPPKPEMRAKWLELCGLQDVRKNLFICRRHFRPSFLHKHKLLMHAYPELNLGLEDYDPLLATKGTESIDTDEDQNDSDDEDGHKSDANSSDNNKDEDADADKDQSDAFDNREADKDCNKCATQESRYREMQEQIDAMREKITHLEAMLHTNSEDDGEEYIWLLLK